MLIYYLAIKTHSLYFAPGELAEWSIAAVLKTVDCYRSGGSNPSLSAAKKPRSNKLLRGFLFYQKKGQ